MLGADPPTLYTEAEVQKHNTAKSIWVSANNKVYDISEFMFDHPGGEEFLLQHAGRDITGVMKDETEHLHSDLAYDMLEQYTIGELETSSKLRKRANGAPPSVTANASVDRAEYTSLLGARKNFIDLNRPMTQQIWAGNFSKSFYLEQVHIPRHAKFSAPILGGYLEIFTQTPWYVVPILWLPIIYVFTLRAYQMLDVATATTMFILGMLNWSVIEYSLHRFLFHVEDILPDHRIAITLHFLLHGVHHYIPMDKMRLVMPPAISVTLAIPLYFLYCTFVPSYLTDPLAAGTVFGYVCYDLTHYYLHHGRPFGAYLKEMKTYHLDHHYKNNMLGYGITSKLWDHIFGTVLV